MVECEREADCDILRNIAEQIDNNQYSAGNDISNIHTEEVTYHDSKAFGTDIVRQDFQGVRNEHWRVSYVVEKVESKYHRYCCLRCVLVIFGLEKCRGQCPHGESYRDRC